MKPKSHRGLRYCVCINNSRYSMLYFEVNHLYLSESDNTAAICLSWILRQKKKNMKIRFGINEIIC